MTTTAQPSTRRNPTNTPPPYSEFRHGPVAAPVNIALCTLFFTTISKYLGLPPWIPLLAGLAMAACLGLAGKYRQPRPLSRVSRVFRGTAAALAGTWSWWQLATFDSAGMTGTQTTLMLTAWPTTILAVYAAIVFRRVPLLLRAAGAGTLALFTLVLTTVMHGPVLTWASAALFETDRLYWGPEHYDVSFPWLGYAVLSLIMIAAPMAVLGAVFANRERDADEELARLQRDNLPAIDRPEARQIQHLVNDLAGEYTDLRTADGSVGKIPNLKITDVTFWDNGAGETYILDLSGNKKGTTRDKLRAYCDDLATKLNLPDGCGVEVVKEPGMSRGVAAMHVARKDVLKELIPYPPIEPRSILNQMPLGKTRAGRVIGPYFRESSAYVWGQKGSGKTGTIFDIIAGALQCTDCLVWVIDLNGGAAAAPFLQSWKDGEVDRPCIDWVATTMEEVREMATVGRNIALDRKKFYRQLKRQADANLMPVGNGEPGQPPPEILIVIDEGKTILGTGDLDDVTSDAQAALMEIMDLARDAAVNIVFSGLRATSDVADTGFKAGTAIRIGMRVTDSTELAYGFGDYKLNPDETPYQGTGFISLGHEESSIQVFKAFFLKPSTMQEIGRTVTPWRPYLDARSLKTAGYIYADRWRRTAKHIWDDPRPEMVNYGAAPASDADRAAASAAGAGAGPAPAAGGTATAVLDRPDPATDGSMIVNGVDISKGLRRPVGEGFSGLVENAKRDYVEERRQWLEREAGRDPAPAPADDGGQPPATGGGDPQPPAEPEQKQPPELDDDELAELDQARIDAMFSDMVKNPTVLASDPQDWPKLPVPVEGELAVVGEGGSRQILERLLLVRGPLGWEKMHEMLRAGGDWGPAVVISKTAMFKLLKKPGSKEPVDWLAPREKGDPYDHRDRLK